MLRLQEMLDYYTPRLLRAASEPMPKVDLEVEYPEMPGEDLALLQRIQGALPILADLCRSDLVLFISRGDFPGVLAIGQAQPHSVSPIRSQCIVGNVFSTADEPMVASILSGTSRMMRSDVAASHRPIMQEAHPVWSAAGQVAAVLSVETNIVEYERHQRRSLIFRRNLAHLLEMGLRGEIVGAGRLSPFAEHDGIVVVDAAGKIRYVSGVAENLHRKLGYADKLLKSSIAEMTGHAAIFNAAARDLACVEMEAQEGQLTWIRKALPITVRPRTWSLVGKSSPRLASVLITIHDATDARRKEQELLIKAAMIQEIHHRVKNNLQTIAALLRLQARRMPVAEAQVALQESVGRILAVAVVHEFLSHDETAVINIREVGARILEQTKQGILDHSKGINLELRGNGISLPAQRATACALVINELVQNAVEHGYTDRHGGTISLTLRQEGPEMVVEVVDDGEGLPAGFDLNQTSSLGLRIVQTLVREDLKGTFALVNGRGVTATIRFPAVAA